MKFVEIRSADVWNTDHAVTQHLYTKTVCIEIMTSFYVTFDRPVTKTLAAVLNYVALSYYNGT